MNNTKIIKDIKAALSNGYNNVFFTIKAGSYYYSVSRCGMTAGRINVELSSEFCGMVLEKLDYASAEAVLELLFSRPEDVEVVMCFYYSTEVGASNGIVDLDTYNGEWHTHESYAA